MIMVWKLSAVCSSVVKRMQKKRLWTWTIVGSTANQSMQSSPLLQTLGKPAAANMKWGECHKKSGDLACIFRKVCGKTKVCDVGRRMWVGEKNVSTAQSFTVHTVAALSTGQRGKVVGGCSAQGASSSSTCVSQLKVLLKSVPIAYSGMNIGPMQGWESVAAAQAQSALLHFPLKTQINFVLHLMLTFMSPSVMWGCLLCRW